jgi:CBS domain-containing protein
MKAISELMKERPMYSVPQSSTVLDAVKFMAEKNIGAVPVVDGNKLVGIFSERDVVKRVIARGLDPATTPLAEVMTTQIVVANESESYESCLKKMQQAHCRHLPVVRGDTFVGVVSLRDLLMIDLDEKERNIEYLQSYIYTVPPGAAKRYESE